MTGWPVAGAVASLGASINLFNLIPVWQLDGARGLKALSRNERLVLGAVAAVAGFGLHQWMPSIVGVVTLGRAAGAGSHPMHPSGDRRLFALFLALVLAHAILARVFDPG